MLKIFTILVITIAFNKLHSSDGANINCNSLKCKHIESCPIGTYLSFARPELGICCDKCTKYQIIDCNPIKCEHIENCPVGTYLSFARPKLGICCATCKKYNKLNEKCDFHMQSCKKGLICLRGYGKFYNEELSI